MQYQWTSLIFMLAGIFAISATGNNSDQAGQNSNLTVLQIAGKNLFQLKKCVDCHTLAPTKENDRTPVAKIRHKDWFHEHVKDKSPIVLREERSKRKQRSVLKAEVAALSAFLFDSKPAEKKQVEAMNANVLQGAYLLYQNNCLNCHVVAGTGKDLGPDLTKVATRRARDWLLRNLNDPQQFAADSEMPKFDKLPAKAKNQIVDYLLTLR